MDRYATIIENTGRRDYIMTSAGAGAMAAARPQAKGKGEPHSIRYSWQCQHIHRIAPSL